MGIRYCVEQRTLPMLPSYKDTVFMNIPTGNDRITNLQ